MTKSVTKTNGKPADDVGMALKDFVVPKLKAGGREPLTQSAHANGGAETAGTTSSNSDKADKEDKTLTTAKPKPKPTETAVWPKSEPAVPITLPSEANEAPAAATSTATTTTATATTSSSSKQTASSMPNAEVDKESSTNKDAGPSNDATAKPAAETTKPKPAASSAANRRTGKEAKPAAARARGRAGAGAFATAKAANSTAGASKPPAAVGTPKNAKSAQAEGGKGKKPSAAAIEASVSKPESKGATEKPSQGTASAIQEPVQADTNAVESESAPAVTAHAAASENDAPEPVANSTVKKEPSLNASPASGAESAGGSAPPLPQRPQRTRQKTEKAKEAAVAKPALEPPAPSTSPVLKASTSSVTWSALPATSALPVATNETHEKVENMAWLGGTSTTSSSSLTSRGRNSASGRRKSMPAAATRPKSANSAASSKPGRPPKVQAPKSTLSSTVAGMDVAVLNAQQELQDACAMLDTIGGLEAVPESPAPDKPMLDKLRESWGGKTYYERLVVMTEDGDADNAGADVVIKPSQHPSGSSAATLSTNTKLSAKAQPFLSAVRSTPSSQGSLNLEVEVLRAELAEKAAALEAKQLECKQMSLQVANLTQKLASSSLQSSLDQLQKELTELQLAQRNETTQHTNAADGLRKELKSTKEQLRAEKEKNAQLHKLCKASDAQIKDALAELSTKVNQAVTKAQNECSGIMTDIVKA